MKKVPNNTWILRTFERLTSLRSRAKPNAADWADQKDTLRAELNVMAPASVKTDINSEQWAESSQTFEKRPLAVPIIGALSLKKQYAITIPAAAAFLAIAVGAFVVEREMFASADRLHEQVNLSFLQAERLSGEVSAAVNGASASFLSADESLGQFMVTTAGLGFYAQISDQAKLSLPQVERPQSWLDPYWQLTNEVDFTHLVQMANGLIQAAELALSQETNFSARQTALQSIRSQIKKMGEVARSRSASTQIFPIINGVSAKIGRYVESGADDSSMAQVLLLLNEDKEALNALSRDRSFQDESGQKFINSFRQSIEVELPALIWALNKASQEIDKTQGIAVGRVADLSRNYIERARADSFFDVPGQQLMRTIGGSSIALFLLTGGLIFLLGARSAAILSWENAQSSAASAALALREKEEVDEAVIRLMRDMSPVMKGDLTHRVTVTEDLTGSVADRFNSVTESISETIVDVKQATQVTRGFIDQISNQALSAKDATKLALDTASSAKEASESGALAVSTAVAQANRQRETMQDVSKRMKRLGEEAQGITNVTDQIEHAAERVRILAMNTSIKATEAGEEGGFFRGMATQLDRMAESTEKSVQQVAALVASLQAETASVIAAVETMTSDVVASSATWDSVRVSFNEIDDQTNRFNEIMHAVAATADLQAQEAVAAREVFQKLETSAAQFKVATEAA